MTETDLLQRIARLSPERLALLVRRNQAARPAAGAPAIVPRADASHVPLSFQQRGFWFVNQLESGSPLYNMHAAFAVRGLLRRSVLAASLAEMARRHEILRARFPAEDGEPVQRIDGPSAIALPLVDLGGLPERLRREEGERLIRQEARRPFDIGRAPLLRLLLVRQDDAAHLIAVAFHHIVSDGWSIGVFIREIVTLYEAFAQGLPSPLPDPPLQYADYAVWQQRALTDEVLDRQISYWREVLQGAPELLDLPSDRPRPAVRSPRGGEVEASLGSATSAALRQLATEESATLYMVLLAGLQAFLARLSGRNDVVVGSPTAGRDLVETEGVLGPFVNAVVRRTRWVGDPSFRHLLGEVRRAVLAAAPHSGLPFDRLVEAVQLERSTGFNPLFQVCLVLHNEPVPEIELPDLALRPVSVHSGTAKFDLTLALRETAGRLAGTLEYAADLYDRTTAWRLTGQLGTLLAAAAAEPDRKLSELPLLTAAERHQVLLEWNDTQAETGGAALLHQAFEEQADRRPEALAAVWEAESATYGELEARANRLASFLGSIGAGPEASVGVWMDRSIDLLVALLGACKAGAAYLPIDPSWPAERAAAVLAGTRAAIVLTRRDHLPAVQSLQWGLPHLTHAVCLDLEAPQPPPEPLDLASIQELWDAVSERAVDWVTEAGFWSAYTGEPFSEAEVLEYRDRVVGLAEPWLESEQSGPGKRVLEIGSGSGLILWELAPRVGHYVGVDPSQRTQERNRERAKREGHANVELLTGFAHEIEALPPGSFDLVILASTVQFFPGLNYLEKVLDLALSRLVPGGGLVVADVMDPRRRDDFRRSLAERAAGRTEGRELYVDEAFFADLPGALPAADGVRILHREAGFPNELRFRYDVVVQKAAAPAAPAAGGRSKRVWSGWHVAQTCAMRPLPAASPIDIAYVIHTSGSTGEPKGIVVQHRPAVELCRWVNASFGVGPGDRLLFVTSPAFDLSVYDVFGVLGAGGTVHVASESTLRDPEELMRLLVEEPITVWDSAPAALQQLAPLLPAPGTVEARLRLVLLSGDWIPVPLPDVVRASFTNARVISLGGATEATVWSNWFPVREVDPAGPSIPYGRPITNARYHVLDKDLAPRPIGVPGHLYIGGACLCVGYARLPERTAERFLPDPFAEELGARLHATGDRARYGHNGNLEFLGRVDQQVKVRGYRIELEEIEAVLSRHPGVREAAVVAREDVPGDKRLVGYVVPMAWPAPTAAELRAALQRVMPEYMVPWTFVALERMPLTANGKLDRKGLPAPLEMAPIETDFVAPETDTERAVALIWHEVLGLPRIGRNDNFFALGGHSLQMMKIASRLRDAFGVQLPLRTLYKSSTVAALAARVEQELGSPRALQGPLLGSLPRPALIPLSGAQRRLWFLDQLDPGRPTYNVPLGLRLRGALDMGALAAALGRIVERHEVLRTSFPSLRGEPYQAIAAPAPPPLPLVDLAGLPERLRRAEAERTATSEARAPFELATGPVLRLHLLRLAPDEHDLLVVFHHIAADGWSVRVFVKELETLYTAGCQGRTARLPDLPVQYADFALWHNEWLRGDEVGRQLDWWRKHLAGAAPLDLATDRPRPAVQRQRGAFRSRALSGDLAAGLRALASQQGVTLFATLLASVEAVLGRSAGQRDLTIGSPLTNRGRSELEGLIGFFANTIVLRGDLSGDPPFRRLLAAAQEEVVAAQEHQDAPFERLVEVLQPDRDLGRSPLFQVMLTVENGGDEARLARLDSALRVLDTGVSKFDLGFTFFELEGARVAIDYDTDLFEAPTIERLLDHWLTLLAGAAATPETPLSQLPLLPEAARHQLLVEWSAHEAGEQADDSIHGLIEAQVRRAPGAVAVVCGDVELSYAELDRQAVCLARRLVDLGAGPEVRIGILLRRSTAMVVALLAALKSGAAYLPLDPAYPARRLELMLEDASPAVVVTEEPLLPLLPPGSFQTVCLDSFEPGPSVGTSVRVEPENLVYLIYTSGSTGRPKGVAIPHRGATALLRWARQTFPPEALAGTLAGTSICFDLSVFELFAPLAWGGRVFLAENALALASLPRAGEVTLINTVPSVLTELVRLDAIPPSVAIVNLAGEPLQRALVDEIYRRSNAGQVLNLYGPSEDTTYSTWARMERGNPGAPPIGRPVAGTRAYVLDRDLGPVPPGQPGELALAGAGLARGYFGRPELTAERFVPDPFSADGARLYRTGDRARWRPDGHLELLGRFDHQVKIRGFRIEPGEIEAALREHPAVLDVKVGIRDSAGLGKRLVAWVVPDRRSGGVPEIPELRLFLARSLPAAMVPAAFVILDRLPLSPNGKIDLRALPDPDAQTPRSAAPERPCNDLEQKIAAVWSEILERKEIGIHDNFFELGGHSLLAVRVISHLQEALARKIRVLEIFEHPTVASLAAALSTGTEEADLAASRSRAAARRDSLRKRERGAQKRIAMSDEEERRHDE